SPGEVVLDERAWALLGPQAMGEPLPGGFVRLRSLPSAPELSVKDALPPEPPGLEPSALRAFVPRTVLSRLDAGHAEWMAEVRPVSALFINLKEPRLMLRGERAEFQRVTLAVQQALATFEGHLNQIVTEDKGIVFACTFGLPPLCHENDAERAVRGALAIGEALRAQGLRHGIGVTTGRAFCGTYGAESRCEYAVLGDVVNLSARLMQRAEDEVLCDEPTARATRGRVELEELPPVQLKGKSTPISLSRVLRNKVAGATPAFDTSTWLGQQPLLAAYRAQLERGMVGRKREREQVRGLLDELAAGIGGALLLEADTGLGKTMLLSALLADAAERQLPCLVGLGDAIERAVAYRAWRPLLEALLTTRARASAEGATSEEPLREGLREALADHPHGTEWEPLLANVLGLRLPENEVTRAMATEVRGENTHALLVHLLEQTLVRRAFVVAFDDAQWLDPESWRLLVEVRRRVPTVLVVLAGRGMEEVLEERHQLLAAGRSTRLELRPLEPDEAHALVCRRLGVVEALPESLATLLYEKAEGHPLFLEELAYSLYGLGVLRVEDGECQLTVEAGRLREVHLPDTLQGAALSRMDQCSPQQQLVLKVASVVGRTFSYRTVHDVLPVERDLLTLDESLTSLVQRNLTRVDRPEPERVYAFQHGLLHQAAYELLAASQRRALHRAVAQWYERVRGEEPEVYPKLAHHWLEAAELKQALHYLDLASTSAWGRGASREAVYLIEQALALEDKAGLTHAEPLRRARWFRTLGEAAFEGGASEKAVERYRQALDALGLPLPRSRFGWVLRLGRELLHGAVTAWWPRARRRA
ncbi:ATP-binding protein, partial [Archangium sp.]|uniref:ATP-binding protein n=1 Tax=Archangium sp. TaxID=1872627 RepID=UPI002EDAF0B8